MTSITIFTTNTCAYCAMVKKYLDMKGQKYEVVNLDEYPERRQEAYELSGALTVPITVVEKREHEKAPRFVDVVVGWNAGKLAAAIS